MNFYSPVHHLLTSPPSQAFLTSAGLRMGEYTVSMCATARKLFLEKENATPALSKSGMEVGFFFVCVCVLYVHAYARCYVVGRGVKAIVCEHAVSTRRFDILPAFIVSAPLLISLQS